MDIIFYVAPSAAMSIEAQIKIGREYASREDWIRVDRPLKDGAIPRDERDFIFGHLIRHIEDKPPGSTRDRVAVVALDALGSSRAEVITLFRTLAGMGVDLVSVTDQLAPDLGGTEHSVRFVKALERAQRSWQRRARKPTRRKKGGKKIGRRPGLTTDEYPDLIRLRDRDRKTWPEIEAHYAALGRTIKQSTLRAHYDRATQTS